MNGLGLRQGRRLVGGSRAVGVSVALALFATVVHGAEVPPALAPLAAMKETMAEALVVPIEACVRRRDTGHAAFHGCVDWHSSVHGTWSLIAYMRATGDGRFDRLLREKILTPEAVAREFRFLQRRPGFEMPYGRAWFLRLAIDYEKRYGDGRLSPMARYVADSLASYLARRGKVQSPSYDSASWAIINLLDYGHFSGEPERLEMARDLARWLLDQAPVPCPIDRERGHFMAICTNIGAVAARLMVREGFAAWLQRAGPELGALVPVTRPENAHHFGLNFSRAWGLWQIFQASGEPRWAKAYADHFTASYGRPGHWRGDYRKVGHWVAQFGLYALQPLFGPERGR